MKLWLDIHVTESITLDHRFSCIDSNTYDGAPDAGPQVVGYGPTEIDALRDFVNQLEDSQA